MVKLIWFITFINLLLSWFPYALGFHTNEQNLVTMEIVTRNDFLLFLIFTIQDLEQFMINVPIMLLACLFTLQSTLFSLSKQFWLSSFIYQLLFYFI